MTASHTVVRSFGVAVACLLAVAISGCVFRTDRPALVAPGQAPVRTNRLPYLKAHMKNGEVFLLAEWQVSDDRTRLEGRGTRFSPTREAAGSGPQALPIDTIALLETNAPERVVSLAAGVLGGLTVVMGTVTMSCVLDPKSCFGSCPTFYTDEHGAGRPDAEGFSESIARALESRDVDALFVAAPSGGRFALTMRNEAQETHVVRRVRLLVAPRPPGGRVLAGVDGAYYPATGFTAPQHCRAPEGDCRAVVEAFDDLERKVPADAADLATREEIDLAFPAAQGRLGLVVAARQSLMSTFLFYQTLAYLGRSAGDFLAGLERGGPAGAERAMGMARRLGGIEASVADAEGQWKPIGTFDEAGPIAGDVRVLPFESDGQAPIRIRLREAQGHWRLGWVAVVRLGDAVAPRAVAVASVTQEGRASAAARDRLRGEGGPLVTLPGDAYRLHFDLPDAARGLELFLEAEGYYYEWMREEWLAEENPWMAALAFAAPDEALRRLAAPFKAREAQLETSFWASRFRKGGAR